MVTLTGLGASKCVDAETQASLFILSGMLTRVEREPVHIIRALVNASSALVNASHEPVHS